MCATAPASLNNRCVPTRFCGKATEGITPTCTEIGKDCDSSKGTGCGKGLSCATAPSAKVDKCVPSDQCDKIATGDTDKTTCAAVKGADCDPAAKDKGCGEGKRCATAPADLKNTCVASEACGKKTGDVETTCGAKTLVAGLVAALAIASTM